jgi:signal transduction histidine kinase
MTDGRPPTLFMVMPRLAKSTTLARVAPWANVALLMLAVVVTALLAYRAQQAASAHRSTAEQTLREYAAFAAFELRNATLSMVTGQHSVAMNPVLRAAATRPDVRIGPKQVADLVQPQNAQCRCLDGVLFYYRMTFNDSAVTTTPSPLATPQSLRWFRDSMVAFGVIAGRRFERAALAGAQRTSLTGAPVTPTMYVPIQTRIDGRRVIMASVLTISVLNRPAAVYGFATDPEQYFSESIKRVLQSGRLLPPALTRGIPLDSILAVRVYDLDGELVYQNATTFESRYAAAVDSLEARNGGLRFNVAINPALVDRLIIGGMPRSNLTSLIGLFALSVGLLVLVIYQLSRQQALVRMRSEFVSGVSHELRTPLAQIRVLAELLRLGKLPDEDKRERSLRIIDQEARRLSFLVESILSFSGLDREKIAPTMTDVAVEIDEIIAGFEPLASNNSVRLSTNLERGLVANVDRSAMRQVLINLLDNAVRYGPEGQTVKVTTESHNGTWRLTVEDQGKGIPPTERERIFEPYYRLNRDARGEKGGSGIGLAVVRGLVEKHGGRVMVEDAESGSGARFSLELPIAGPGPVADK